ncbi:hypothetical protein JXR93_06210 [bacterium]|nr:hypothetical protein [bacterium]
MRRDIISIFVLFLIGITLFADNSQNSDFEYILSKDISNIEKYTDDFGINSIKSDSNGVIIDLIYGGGCSKHYFYVSSDIQNEKDDTLDIFIFHNSNQDSCDALLTKQVFIEFSKLEKVPTNIQVVNIKHPKTKWIIKTITFENQKYDVKKLTEYSFYGKSIIALKNNKELSLEIKNKSPFPYTGYVTKFDKNNKFTTSYIAQCGNDCFSILEGEYKVVSEKEILIVPKTIKFLKKEYCDGLNDTDYKNLQFKCDISFNEKGMKLKLIEDSQKNSK